MTREQALDYLTSTGLTKEQVMEVVEALEQQTCEDAVSRNLITQTLNKMDRYVAEELTLCDTDKKFPKNEVFIVDDVYEQIVEQLPSVQPKTTVCEDAVSREAVLGLFAQNADAVRPYSKTWEEVKDLPSVKPQPKTGHWIVHPKGIYAHLICDNCLSNAPYDCRTNYCPDCGAKMIEPQESEGNE